MGSYSEKLTDHVMTPRNGGAIENPDATRQAGARALTWDAVVTQMVMLQSGSSRHF
jgi:hypothetical protein